VRQEAKQPTESGALTPPFFKKPAPLGESQPGGLPRGPHYDFITPEYSTFQDIQDVKWETVRGIGHSFGYSRQEGDEQLLSLTELIHLFVDVVIKNGNLLLNVGPMADGTIPQNQRQRLEQFGQWLDVNGEAMFGARPWIRAESRRLMAWRSGSHGRAARSTPRCLARLPARRSAFQG